MLIEEAILLVQKALRCRGTYVMLMEMYWIQNICRFAIPKWSITFGFIFAGESFYRLIVFTSKVDSVNEEFSTPREARVMRGVYISVAALNCVLFMTNILLIIGVIQKRPSYIIPWLIAYSARATAKGLAYLILAIVLPFETFIAGCSLVCALIFCIYVELRYYRVLCRMRDRSWYNSVGSDAHEI